jgi:NitT/TauT family transport system permease protein
MISARSITRVASQISVFIAFFLAWEVAVDLLRIKPVILPSPSLIAVTIAKNWPYLALNTVPTLTAVALAFLIAAIVGVTIAIAITYSKWISELVYPFLVVSQVLPKIALAPLFIIWFGFGLTPKVVIASLLCVFPIVVNTARGLASVEPELIQYMKSLGAGRLAIFFKLSLPSSLPFIFAAFKIAITMAIVGVVVGEFVSADKGLGHLINYANVSLNTELMFAGLAVLSAIGVSLFVLVVLAERLLLSWGVEQEISTQTL